MIRGRNGLATLKLTRLGQTGRCTGPTHSRRTVISNPSWVVPSSTTANLFSMMNNPKNDNLANAAIERNDIVEKLFNTNNKLTVTNKQLTDTILKMQEQNTDSSPSWTSPHGRQPQKAASKRYGDISTDIWDPSGYTAACTVLRYSRATTANHVVLCRRPQAEGVMQ
eukprot:CCRYP_019986-RA/>CCRYP_019986-RA protein AED:0.38 eAED:0.57 QI:0/0/0/1/0/0/2/0/166